MEPDAFWPVEALLVGAGDADIVPPLDGAMEDMPPCVVVEAGGVLPEDIPGAVVVGEDIDELSGAGPGVMVWADANPAEQSIASVANGNDRISSSYDNR